MAVDLINNMSYQKQAFMTTKMEETAVQEAASGIESVNKLIRLLSQQNQSSKPTSLDLELNLDCNAAANVAVSKFKRVISLLGRTRTGHARFRRAPVIPPPPPPPPPPPKVLESNKVFYATPIQQVPSPFVLERKEPCTSAATINFSSCNNNNSNNNNNNNNNSVVGGNSFVSSLTGETTIVSTLDYSNMSGRPQVSSCSEKFQVTNMSSGKPPISSSSSSLKRRCSSDTLASGKCSASSGRCHCSKKRKLRMKRVVRVPAISLKMADIPPDDYSWRKYGQKPIKGSPHPRGYYKCSSMRGCPARKHVERAVDDPTMLVVTYEGEHNHNLPLPETSNLILESS